MARKSPPSRRAAPGAARPSSETRRAANARLQRAAAGDRPYIVGLLVLIILLGGMAAGPLKSFTLGADRVDTLAASRDQLRAEVDRLEERRVRLEDPEELEIIAREQLNLVKPGEVPFIVVTPEAEFERAEPGQGAGPGEVPLWRRLADSLAGLFG